MERKFEELIFVSVLLRVGGVVFMFAGVGVCVWLLVGSRCSGVSGIVLILGVVGCIVVGLGIYSLGEIISLLLKPRVNGRVEGSKES